MCGYTFIYISLNILLDNIKSIKELTIKQLASGFRDTEKIKKQGQNRTELYLWYLWYYVCLFIKILHLRMSVMKYMTQFLNHLYVSELVY